MASTCDTCKSRWTGGNVEHCLACHLSFTGTRAGDKHRVVYSVYTVNRLKDKTIKHLEDGLPLPKGAKIISVGNHRFRCLTEDEMLARGMVKNSYGLWSAGASSYAKS